MSSGLILNVSFNEKEEAKALGARWNARLKTWYIPSHYDLAPFSRWLPEVEESLTYALAPLYLAVSTEVCWKCKESCPVFCLAAEGYEDEGYFDEDAFVTFADLAKAPKPLFDFLHQNCPSYYTDYSHTVGAKYLMNHCDCGAKQGDFYLHSEPEGAFSPISREQAENIVLYPIDFINDAKIQMEASYGLQEPNFIAEYAQRR